MLGKLENRKMFRLVPIYEGIGSVKAQKLKD